MKVTMNDFTALIDKLEFLVNTHRDIQSIATYNAICEQLEKIKESAEELIIEYVEVEHELD